MRSRSHAPTARHAHAHAPATLDLAPLLTARVLAPLAPASLVLASLAAATLGLATPANAAWEDMTPAAMTAAPMRLGYDPTDPDRLFLGSYGEALWRTNDGGASWIQEFSDFYEGDGVATILVVDTEFSPTDPSRGIAITMSGTYLTYSGGASWERDDDNDINNCPGVGWDVIAIPDGSGAVVSELGLPFEGGTFWIFDWDTSSWTVGAAGFRGVAGESTLGLAFDVDEPPVLYGGNTFRCFYTPDLGGTMNWNNPGLPDLNLRTIAADPEIAGQVIGAVDGGVFRQTSPETPWSAWGSGIGGTVFSLVHSPFDTDVVFAGASDGVYRSDDRGATFTPVTTDGMPYLHTLDLTIHPLAPEWLWASASDGSGATGGLYRIRIDDVVAVHPGATPLPFALDLGPNPLRARTTVSFTLESDEHVRVSVYEAGGRRVASILDGVRPGGTHRVVWNGRDDRHRRVAAGVYVVKLDVGGRVVTRTAAVLP